MSSDGVKIKRTTDNYNKIGEEHLVPVAIIQRNVYGGSSQRNNLLADPRLPDPGPRNPRIAVQTTVTDPRWYITNIESIFIGHRFIIQGREGLGYFEVKSIGWDDTFRQPYFTAELVNPLIDDRGRPQRLPASPILEGELISSKDNLGVERIISEDHCWNQGVAHHIRKNVYGDGDGVGSQVSLYYSTLDIMSNYPYVPESKTGDGS